MTLTSGAVAQDTLQQGGGAKAEPAPFVDDAQQYVIQSVPIGARLKLNEKSLFNWTNPTRQQERGAVYVWLHDGRPLVIGSLFTYEINDKVYKKHEFHSLANGPLNATYQDTLAWTPKSPGIQWQEFENAPQPGATHISRVLQMRQLARRFRAELSNPNGDKDELRLQPRPLFEYSSPKSGVTDGVIFSFVVATDPEVLLLVESFEETRGGTKAVGFRYGFARFHFWKVAAYAGEKLIWQAPFDSGQDTNYLGSREAMNKIYISFHPRPPGVAESAINK